MKHLKTYKIFESAGQDLSDIFLEVNDETFWKAEVWRGFEPLHLPFLPDSQSQKWVVVIQTVDDDEEYELEGQTPPPVVIESIERAVDFMNSEGFIKTQITFENSEDYRQIEEIDVDGLSELDVWPNNFIRIEFWK